MPSSTILSLGTGADHDLQPEGVQDLSAVSNDRLDCPFKNLHNNPWSMPVTLEMA
jgi:hypothetical protein